MGQEELLNQSVKVEERIVHGMEVTCVDIQSEQGAKALGRECGQYITIRTGPLEKLENFEDACACLIEYLRPLLAPYFGKTLCICGIGNQDLDFDSLGPETARRIQPKVYQLAASQASFKEIAVVCPGISGYTNLTSEAIIASTASIIDAGCILTIDSSACEDVDRLCSTIQVASTGMQTHSKISRLCQSTLGVPVISIGVPTTISMKNLSEKEDSDPSLFFTPTLVADSVAVAAVLIACAVAQIAYPDLDYDDCKKLICLLLNGIV